MGRSVSYPRNASVVCFRDVSEIEDNEDFDLFLEDVLADLQNAAPSFRSCDRWLDREDHAIAENGHCYVGVSEYCGLAAVWMVPKESDHVALSINWCAGFEDTFRSLFGDLVKVAAASNGEAFYRRTAA